MKLLSERYRSILLGFVFVVALIFILVQSYKSDDVSAKSSSGYLLYATFSDVGGLSKGNEVQLSGVQIGTVVDMIFKPDSLQVKLVMDIADDRIEIPTDSLVAISSNGIFGGRFVSILPGAEFDALEDGDSFDYTNDAIDIMGIMEKVIGSAERAIQQAR